MSSVKEQIVCPTCGSANVGMTASQERRTGAMIPDGETKIPVMIKFLCEKGHPFSVDEEKAEKAGFQSPWKNRF